MPETDEPTAPSSFEASPGEGKERRSLEQRVARLEQRVRDLETALTAGPESPSVSPKTVPSPSARDLEASLAGSFLNYAGLLALLLGLALLIGYLLEPHPLQALGLALVSAAALAGISILAGRRESRNLSFTLEGGALGLGLVAAYLSFRWLGLPLSLLMAAGVALLAMRRALVRHSQLVASFAMLAALLAPLLLRGAQSGEGFLFGYLAVVNAGAVWVGYRKGWLLLRYLALTGSHMAAWFWYVNHPGANLVLTAAFPLLTFALFARLVPSGRLNFAEALLGVINSGGLLAAGYSILHLQAPHMGSWVPLWMGGLHAGMAVLWWRNPALRSHSLLHGWIAGCFVAAGLPIAMPPAVASIGWIAEGFALGWLGVRWNRGWMRAAGDLLGIGAAFTLLLSLPSWNTFSRFLQLVTTIALVGSVYVLHLKRRLINPGPWEWAIRWFLATVAVILPMLTLGRTIATAAGGPFLLAPQLRASAFWAAYSAALCLIGWFAFSAFLRWMGVGLLLITAVKVFVVDPVTLSPGSRIGSFLLLAVFLLLLSYLFQSRRE